MNASAPQIHSGFYAEREWMSRYLRIRAPSRAGRARLVGRVFNPEGQDLEGNRLQIVMNARLIAEVNPFRGAWTPFALALPRPEGAGPIDILLRTLRFRVPPPPDPRKFGMIASGLRLEFEP